MLRTIAGLMLLTLLFVFVVGQVAHAVPPGEKDRTVKILRTTNKAQTNRFVCEALEFKKVNPFNVGNFFWSLISREEGGIRIFANPEKNGGYIVVICPEYQLESLRKLAKELDQPNLHSGPDSAYLYYRMKHRDISNTDYRAASGYYLGASGALVPDIETNSVLIYDARVGAERMKEAFEKEFDAPLRQVEMAVRIYEADVDNDGKLGLDFEAWKNGPGQALLTIAANGAYWQSSAGVRDHFHSNAVGFLLDYPSAYFDFLTAKGKATTVVNTKIAGISARTATLIAGEKILYFSEAHDATNLTRTVTGKQQSTAGIQLNITPTIGDDVTNLDLTLTVSSLVGFDGAGAPILNTLEKTGSYAVKNGQEIMVGGLHRERKGQSTRKIPILGSIPVLGYLFGGEVAVNKKYMVAATVMPTLIGKTNLGAADDAIAKEVIP